jgi:hypothetical protein
MSFIKSKNDVIYLALVAILAISTGYAVTVKHFSEQSKPVQFSELSDADIDVILGVKDKMHEARLRDN